MALLRPHRPARGHGRRRRPPRRRAPTPAACCSATSPSSSTRATPRSPSDGPPRSASTRACSPSCSAGPSCASCSTPRCSPRSRPSCSGWRPTAGPASAEAVADLLRLLGPLTIDEVAARVQASSDADVGALADRRWPTHAGSSPYASQARSAGPRSRTSPGCATASACPSRPAPPTSSPSRPRTRSATSCPATPAPTAPSPPPTSPPGSGSARPSPGTPCNGWRRAADCSRASSARPAAARSGATPRCCASSAAARWPGSARRSSRSRPRRWPASCRPGNASAASSAASTACVAAIDQLAGCPVPASALEPLVLASRVSDYEPRFLDELTSSGEVIWAGHAPLPGSDGWVSLHLADQAHLTLPDPQWGELDELQQSVLEALAPGGAWFFRQLSDRRRLRPTTPPSSPRCGTSSGRASSPTTPSPRCGRWCAPAPPATARRRAPPRVSRSGGRMPARTGPPETAGRWSVLPALDADPTRRAHATAEHLLERHGVVTRGAVMQERIAGGFAGVYKVLSAFEDTGRCRRGYFVEGLGAAQFGTAGAIDRLRTFSEPDDVQAGRRRAGRDRPGQSLRRRAALARQHRRRRAPPGPQGRRAGRARRRPPDAVRRARRPHPPHLERRHGPPDHRGRGPRRRRTPRRARQADRREGRRRSRCSAAATPRCDRRSTPQASSPHPRG